MYSLAISPRCRYVDLREDGAKVEVDKGPRGGVLEPGHLVKRLLDTFTHHRGGGSATFKVFNQLINKFSFKNLYNQ